MCSLLSSHGMWSVSKLLPHRRKKQVLCNTEMPVRDMVFTEVLEINAHAHTVDTRHSFFSLLGTGYQASNYNLFLMHHSDSLYPLNKPEGEKLERFFNITLCRCEHSVPRLFLQRVEKGKCLPGMRLV